MDGEKYKQDINFGGSDCIINLSVFTIPGMRVVDVPLVPDTTADDVIAFCKTHLKSKENYCLAADFDGFDKQFGPDERLFHLVKKQILVKNHKNNVKFFLRKKKRVVDHTATSSITSKDNLSIQQSESTSDIPLIGFVKDEKMAVNNNSQSSLNSTSPFSALSYNDLIQLAERQKRTIESNNVVIVHKETRLKSLRQQTQTQSSNNNTLERLQKLRQQVQTEEVQLQRLRHLKVETEEEIRRNSNAQTELQEARRLFADKERQLKEAAERVEEMSRRLDMLRRRRMLIAKETELKRLDENYDALTSKVKSQNVSSSAPLAITQQLKFNSSVNSLLQKRPKAAVEPFKVIPPQHDHQEGLDADVRQIHFTPPNSQQNSTLNSGYLSSKGFLTAFSAMEEVLDQKPLDALLEPKQQLPHSGLERTNQGNFSSPKHQSNKWPLPSILETSLLLNGYGSASVPNSLDTFDNADSSRKVNVSMNRRFQWTSAAGLFDDAPPPDVIPSGEKNKYIGVTTDHIDHNALPISSAPSTSTSEANFIPSDPDKIAIRNDTMRAAKRRSWAEHHGGFTNDEAEHIRMLLCREQQRGKSSVNLSWIFGQLNGNGNNVGQISHADLKATARLEDEQNVNYDDDGSPPPPPPCPPPEILPDENMNQEMRQLNNETPPNVSYDDDRPPSSITIIEVFPEVDVKPPPKGILRPAHREGSGQRIRFDPLALLLDSALEGELELVKKCAGQIRNVSESNDEGITALHNAICAGHYEIVRFLVEADADVNAQDSDGWTPLHCAASCNNLPMVKFLVERGACVFATTVSDHETPSDKCEEDEDGFDGCSQFLLNIQEKIGTLNNGKVYAAYDFEAQYEDELDFKVGDEMVVLSKSDKEKGWWWAKHTAANIEGYVPRNFLALYPRLSFQRALAMACEIEPSNLIDPIEKSTIEVKGDENFEVNPLPLA